MNMTKKAFAAVVVGIMTAAFAACGGVKDGSDVVWNGGGDGTSWLDGQNWKGGSAPSTTNIGARINAGADLVINLNTNGIVDAWRLYMGYADSRKITLNGDPGAMLRNNRTPNGYASDIVLSTNGEFTLNVPVVTAAGCYCTVYNRKAGIFHCNSVLSNEFGTSTGVVGGTNYFGTGSGIWATDSTCSFGTGTDDVGRRSLVQLTGDAFIKAKSLNFGGSYESASADFVQDGPDTLVEVSGNLTMGYNKAFESVDHHYYLKSGKLSVGGQMWFSGKQAASWYQSGGTATVASVSIASDVNSRGEFSVTGGKFECLGVFSAASTGHTFTLSDCTLCVGASSSIARPVRLCGTVSFEIPTGVTLTLENATVPAGTRILQSGGGTLKICPGGECRFDSPDPLSLGAMTVAGKGVADVTVDEGSSLTVDSITFAGDYVSRGTFKVLGGSFSSAGALSFTGSNYGMVVSNATFAVGANSTIPVALALHSNVTFNVASGATLTLSGPTTLSPDVKITKTGAGELRFAHDLVWRGDMDIREGRVSFANGYAYENADGDESVRRIDIRADGNLYVDSFSAEITSPRDVYVEDGGYIYIGDRSLFPVRHMYTNGEEVAHGVYYADTGSTLPFRGGSNNAVLAIPWIWTGEGDGTNWTDAANWENSDPPKLSTAIYIKNSAYTIESTTRAIYLDLSAATNLVLNNNKGDVITIGGMIYNPNSGSKRLTIQAKFYTGGMNAIRINRGSTQTCCFVGPGREMVFDDIQIRKEGGPDYAFHGSGTYYFQGGTRLFSTYLFKNEPQRPDLLNHNIMPAAKCVFQYMTNDVANGQFIPESYTCFGMGDNDRFSDIVFGQGLNLTVTNLFWGTQSGFSTTRQYHQKPGSIISAQRVYLTAPHATKRGPGTYFMEGGELSASIGFYLGSMFADTTDYRQYPWGDFQMTGGVLRAPVIGCENNQNWMHFVAGDVYVGAGGFVKTVATRSNSGWRVFVENTTPCVQWGGGTIHATDDFTFGLDAALSGRGGDATLDTAGHTVTFTATLTGDSTLVKTGAGEIALNGTMDAVRIAVEEGSVSFGADLVQNASLEMLSVPSDSAIAVAADKSVSVKTLLVDGVKMGSGTYQYGDGEVVVEGDSDWLADAPYSASATATCDDAKALSSLSYSCAVSPSGTLTISGSGSIAFSAGATIYVRSGDTLRIQVPITLAGDLSVIGGGTVVFEDDGTVSLASGASSANFFVLDGSTVTVKTVVNGGDSGNEFLAHTANGCDALSTLRVEGGGSIYQVYSPTVGDTSAASTASVGGVLEIATGGTFRFKNNVANVGGKMYRKEKIHLCGGTLRLHGMMSRVAPSDFTLVLDSGTVWVDEYSYQVLPAMEVALGGDVTFYTSYTASQQVSLKCDFTGSGTIRKTGIGTLCLYGDMSAVSKFTVDEGVLCITEESAPTISEEAEFRMANGARLLLEYDGTVGARILYLGGKEMPGGVYGEGVSPSWRAPDIVGKGFISFSEGKLPGVIMIIK